MVRPVTVTCFLTAVLSASGCGLVFPPAGSGAGGLTAPAATPLQQQQRAIDSAKERLGIVMDVITPLIERGVLTDPAALRTIRTAVKQVDVDLKAAQAQLSAGQLLTAAFLTDRVIGAVVTLERVRDANAGAGK